MQETFLSVKFASKRLNLKIHQHNAPILGHPQSQYVRSMRDPP